MVGVGQVETRFLSGRKIQNANITCMNILINGNIMLMISTKTMRDKGDSTTHTPHSSVEEHQS